MAFDSLRGVSVLFGGPSLAVTYEYNGQIWTQRATSGPSPRAYAPFAFDPVRGVCVLSGGNLGGQSQDGTFEWSGTSWTQLAVGGPGPRQGQKFAFDTNRNELIHFGGYATPAVLTNQTWVLPTLSRGFADWTSISPSQAVGDARGNAITITSTQPNAFSGSILDGSSTWFNDASLFSPTLARSDILAIQATPAGVTYTVTFNQPVVNPLLHFQSLAATLTFIGVSPVKVSGQPTFVVSGNQIIGNFIGPPPSPNNDANGTIQLPGTFSSVSFTARWSLGTDGIGMQLGLGLDVPISSAGQTDNAVTTGSRADPGPSSTTTYSVNSFTIQSGTSWTLGSGEILNAPGGLVVNAGAVFIANGTINGPLINNGLTIIPITRASLVSRVVPGPSRGVIIIPVPTPLPGPQPAPIPVPFPSPPSVETGEMLVISGSGPGAGAGGGVGGTGGGSSSGGGGIVRFETLLLPIEGTLRYDSLLEVTGSVTQSATGITRLFIAGTTRGETYSALDSGQNIALDGGIQVVLRPELFDYTPSIGDSFDVMFAPGGITLPDGNIDLTTYLTTTGAAQLGLSLPRYISPFTADPDVLVQFPSSLFSYSIVNGGTTLRLTMTNGVCSSLVTASEGFNICPGPARNLSVTPLGSGPFTFQWRKRATLTGTPVNIVSDGRVTGANAATLNFASVINEDTGFYDCVVTRGGTCGSSIIAPIPVFVGCSNRANVASSNQGTTCDEALSADDIIVFLSWYFAGDLRADFAGPNQSPNPDGAFTADDIIVFLGLYFAGC